MENILAVRNLTKDFKENKVLKGINFEVGKGEILCFLGPNGAGKTTTINILTAALKSDGGEVLYKGKKISKQLRAYKQQLGVVPQEIALYEELSAERNVRFFASLYGLRGQELAQAADRALEFAGLTDRRKDKVKTFSGGMKRRLNIACAIAHSPEVVIMDEPTVGIDPQSRNHILHSIKKLRDSGMTINESLQLDFKPDKELAGEEKHITDRSILERVQVSLPAVSSATVTKKQAFSKPPLPFNLVKLQAYMNEKYNMSVCRTLEVTQTLRDKYKAITYNRSDCQYLKEEHFGEAPRVIGKVLEKLQLNIPVDYSIKSDCFNDENITAHHAIIPTDSNFDINSLEGDLRLVYMEIAKRYIIQFLQPVELTVTRIIDPVPGGMLEAESTEVINQGYSRYYKAEEKKQTALSRLVPGIYSCNLQGSEIIEKKTTPPKRYTQATLITDMTSISKYVDDPKIKQILKDKDKGKKGENGSIGTPATRDKIIETLIKRGYIMDHGKNLYSTQLGRDFYNLLPDDIKKPDMTALWWTIQEDIKAGTATPEDMTRSVLDTFKSHLQTDYSSAQISRQPAEREQIGKCPICGKPVYESKASFGCSGYIDGCKFALWKDNKFFSAFGKSITKTQAKALLGAKRRCLVSGIKKKDGSGTYDAYFVMTIKNGYPSFEMELPSKKPVHKR